MSDKNNNKSIFNLAAMLLIGWSFILGFIFCIKHIIYFLTDIF